MNMGTGLSNNSHNGTVLRVLRLLLLLISVSLWWNDDSSKKADAFQTPSVAGSVRSTRTTEARRQTTTTRTRTPSVLRSTALDEERMTASDEEILFGNDDDTVDYDAPQRQRDTYGNLHSKGPRGIAPRNPLDHASDPLINKLQTMRETLTSCPQLWRELGKICPDLRAVYDQHLCDTKVDHTFASFATAVAKSARVWQDLGVGRGQIVAVLGENSATWLTVDQGLQSVGAASAVRGADAPLDELRYIYDHSGSAGLAVLQGPRLLSKLVKDKVGGSEENSPLGLSNAEHGPVRTIVLMHREKKSDAEIEELAQACGDNVRVYVFADLMAAASPLVDVPTVQRSDLATIVYTSGTTGRPKGVMLTHSNLLHQTGHRLGPSLPYEQSEPLPGETMVSLLPVWHITERTFELWMASRGCSVVYSTIRTFKKDLAKHKPQWMVLVPRVLEKIASGVQDKFSSGSAAVKVLSSFFTKIGRAYYKHKKVVRGLVVSNDATVNGLDEIWSRLALTLLSPLHAVGNKLVWSKVRDGFGGRNKVIISGGSALAGGLETFYETAGLTLSVGYGLTECSPLISFRRTDKNLVTGGCAGKPCTNTELRIVDPASLANNAPRDALPEGEAGLVIAKGPQIMKGYFKNQDATDKAIDQFGWFDTGDLGRINPATGDLILTGRAKDTIVLSNGENIEPVPIEDAIMGEGPLIDQVMLAGQDGRNLVAITVLNPSELANAGIIDRAQATVLEDASEKVNDPKCSPEDCAANCKLLTDASETLRSNADVKKSVSDVFRRATADFRKWEKVSDFYLTLEPFAMANGQLTQSYKVKRAQVMERYEGEL